MNWLVTGGAGYIGAHVVRALKAQGLNPVVYDDLSSGSVSSIPADVSFVEGSVLDTRCLIDTFREHMVTGVVHLAAKKSPAESVSDPIFYYKQNVHGMTSLIEAMYATRIERIVLSSSAAVYGNNEAPRVREDAALRPENPYGQTKLICEWMVEAAARAYNLYFVNLRYFNVAGASETALADRGTANLIPTVFRALRSGTPPQVFGTDYATPDGTCVRDYIHVVDLASVHAIAASELEKRPIRTVYNVGTGNGTSVLEVLAVIREVTRIEFKPEYTSRRPGDPASVVGDVSRISRELGWQARHDIYSMVSSAWDTE